MTTIKERIAKATECKMPNCAANDALTELLNPTDEMIEAMVRDWFGGFILDESTLALVRGPLKSAFRAAIQKALES